MENFKEAAKKQIEKGELIPFAQLNNRDELSCNISTKDLIKGIKIYNNMIELEKDRIFNETFEW